MEDRIGYKSGFKYQLVRTYCVYVDILNLDISTKYLRLTPDGWLTIYSGYCWDGPSGPTIDTKTFMRAALVHDALYQLMRMEILPIEARKHVDELLYKMCREDKMIWIRAQWVYRGVRLGAGYAADPSAKKEIRYAP